MSGPAPPPRVRHVSPQPGPRKSSLRSRTSTKILKSPSTQNLRSPRTPELNRPAGILKSVAYDVHSASPPQRVGPSTAGTKLPAKKLHRGRPAAMFRTRLPSLGGSTTTAYDPDEDDNAEPCPSPVVGDSRHNANLGLRNTKFPNLQESRDWSHWRKSIEARQMKKPGDINENPIPQNAAVVSQRDSGFMTSENGHHEAQLQIPPPDQFAGDRADVESIDSNQGICGIPSLSTISSFRNCHRSNHSLREHLLRKNWLNRDKYRSQAAAFQFGNDVKEGNNRDRASIPRRVKGRLAPNYLKPKASSLNKARTKRCRKLNERSHATETAGNVGKEEGLESWQTLQGVLNFHRESMNFGDFTGEVERGWQNAVQTDSIEPHRDPIKPGPALAVPFEMEVAAAAILSTPAGSPIRDAKISKERIQKRLSTRSGVFTDEYGSPQAQNGPTGITTARSAMVHTRIFDIEKASEAKAGPEPGPRTSSMSAVLCMPFERFVGASPSFTQNSGPQQSATYVTSNGSSGPRRLAAAMDLRSRMSSIISMASPPTFGPLSTMSTDTLTMIEHQVQAQANISHTRSPSVKFHGIDVGSVSIRSSRPSGNPPERPLPEIPTNQDPLLAERVSAGSRTSSHTRRTSKAIGSGSFHKHQSSSVSTGTTIHTVPREDFGMASPPRSKHSNLGTIDLHCSSNLSTHLEQPTISSQSVPRLIRKGSDSRASRVHAIKKRDISSDSHRHHRRISEEKEEDPTSTDHLKRFPAVPPSSSPASANGRHSRQHSRSHSATSQSQHHRRTYSSSRHAQFHQLTRQVLAQSNIMVWADTNPITAMFRAGAMSPSPSMSSLNNRSPRRNDTSKMPLPVLKESRRSVTGAPTASAPPMVVYPQLMGSAHTPLSSAGEVEATSILHSATSPVARRGSARRGNSISHQITLSSPRRKTAAASVGDLGNPRTARDRYTIGSEIQKIGIYLEQLEADRAKHKKRVLELEHHITHMHRRDLANRMREEKKMSAQEGFDTRIKNRKENQVAIVPTVTKKQSITGEKKYTARNAIPTIRPVSDGSQSSTTPSVSTTETAAKSPSSTTSNDGENVWVDNRISHARGISNIDNIDSMLRAMGLEKSRNVGSVAVRVEGARVRRERRGLVVEGW